VDWCRKHNVVVEAYSPLVQGVRANEPALTALAKKYNKSFAQVLIRWSLQKVMTSLGWLADKESNLTMRI